ncbi:shikimate kinase [Variovorax saccharolyticus]|uniref:shikimate kinase n=1 Tax=Variovorax saccharolyticus TaxID=3053516 RepID=UPI00257614C2|nr:shikimate kinase [Variovorax sp. J31P216]MDM0022959.1 shikimate kinase [Variovorax sp. J31P216]
MSDPARDQRHLGIHAHRRSPRGGVRITQLVGPGGAGKTSAGRILAQRLGWQFVDLDQHFMACEGDVAEFIAAHGYVGYARRNLAIYGEAKRALTTSAVFALSSGFMTYPVEVHEDYGRMRDAIEVDVLTALLMPAFEAQACAEIIVQRQLARPYLRGDRDSELSCIRERFPMFMALRCARFRSDATPEEIARELENFVRRQVNEA